MRSERSLSLWAAVREEARRFMLQFVCAAGGLAGLWLGFLAAPKRSSSTQLLPAFAEVLLPVGWRVAAGVVAGALVAWTLSIAVPSLRPHATER
jgi:hypothetical protein